MQLQQTKNKFSQKITITKKILLVFFLSFVGCSNPIDYNPPEINKNFFFNSNITTWNLQNEKGNVAIFQAHPEEEISLAMRFWDTAKNSRISVNAVPVDFIYNEDGMKKRQYFALIKQNNELYFATKKHPNAGNYNLGFYIYLFSIPNETPVTAIETDSVVYQYGTQVWKMKYSIEWIYEGVFDNALKIFTSQYTTYNNFQSPQIYLENFSFIEKIGFYGYMGYYLQF